MGLKIMSLKYRKKEVFEKAKKLKILDYAMLVGGMDSWTDLQEQMSLILSDVENTKDLEDFEWEIDRLIKDPSSNESLS